MSKLSSKSNEKLRYDLVKLLVRLGPLTRDELIQALNISPRKLRSLLASLRQKGFKVFYDRRTRTYHLLAFENPDSAVFFILSYIYFNLTNERVKRYIGSYLQERFGLEPISGINFEDFGGFRDQLFMSSIDIGQEMFWKLRSAIAEQKELRIIYRESRDSSPQWFVVRPIYLAAIKGYWYLISYEPSVEGVKLYRLDKIESAFATGRKFKVSDNFFLEDHLPELAPLLKPGRKHKVVVEFEHGMEWVKDRIWHPTQKIENLQDGRFRLEMEISNIEEFMAWLSSFGYKAKLISPKHLIDSYKTYLQLTLALYSKGPWLESKLKRELENFAQEDTQAVKQALMDMLRDSENSDITSLSEQEDMNYN